MKRPSISPDQITRARAEEAKALTLLAFRNGPVEDMHAGVWCEACGGDENYSRLTQGQMKTLNKYMVDRLYELLTLKETDPEEYIRQIMWARGYTTGWDDPAGYTPGQNNLRRNDEVDR